jgi:hypothetical protein
MVSFNAWSALRASSLSFMLVLIYFIENFDFSEKMKFFLSEKASWDLVLQVFQHDGAVLERNNC